eukprot:838212-Amphidinium_carterae.1
MVLLVLLFEYVLALLREMDSGSDVHTRTLHKGGQFAFSGQIGPKTKLSPNLGGFSGVRVSQSWFCFHMLLLLVSGVVGSSQLCGGGFVLVLLWEPHQHVAVQ